MIFEFCTFVFFTSKNLIFLQPFIKSFILFYLYSYQFLRFIMSAIVTELEIHHVLILIAMEAEAAPFISHLGLEKIDSIFNGAPCIFYSGSYNECKVSVVTNGKSIVFGVDNIGTTPAALSTFLAINQLKPDLVINAGTAGGFRRNDTKIGDTFISINFKYHDRRIPIPGYAEYGIGDYNAYPCPNLVKELNFKEGVVTTSNSLDHCEIDDKIMLENNASVKDMEAASIAWAAELTQTPFFAVKVVTDIVDGDKPSQEEFLENLETAAKSLQLSLSSVINFVSGKKLIDL